MRWKSHVRFLGGVSYPVAQLQEREWAF